MRIQEVETQVGITKKNIRFYEQEGLISPQRNRENKYREYSEEDVLRLKKIRLLRRLGIPIDDLRKLFAGTLTVSDTMARHTITLDREIKNLELCKTLCRELEQSGISISELEPDIYLEKMDNLESKGARFMNHRKKDIRKNMTGPVIAALVMILFMLVVDGIFLWANSIEPIPFPILLILLLVPMSICIGVLLALRSRWMELQSGEAEEADQY